MNEVEKGRCRTHGLPVVWEKGTLTWVHATAACLVGDCCIDDNSEIIGEMIDLDDPT